ncbi:4-hydroxy-tetrahydrodipicolinate reductase [Macrococcoides canis]|uniref:4-hydroxy-tetrahydrodipicolinate reductase n=1 Tax=Macrococcoides canis TaxID=1855823 RepID=A0A4R6C6W7_9STAP|nr:4-hydroxy-tetrahydrodipicolinate reductase [Macrococcus canis]TDM18243.1 4-hydroxy-tetrahydrodipicolinate reductase [Macrococcus canis]TDM38193.1 4-hydroxy-tetrahydrodipicolinate reductase [Macrococcus canis]
MRIILNGYGAMNQRVAHLAENRHHEIVGIILSKEKSTPYPVYTLDKLEALPEADVIIDFSNPALSIPLLKSNVDIPIVMATTGEKESIIELLKLKSAHIPVFFSANMSYGVHALTELVKYAVPLLENMDIELIERHHNKKVDAPSGTLVKLLDAITTERSLNPVYDRTDIHTPRHKDEIGISVVRGGTIIGEHEILFAGHDETIQIIHRALSKDIFANGSIDVAEQLIDKENGYYTFENLL